MTRLTLFVVLVSLVLSPAASGQMRGTEGGMWELGLNAASAVPLGDFKDVSNYGVGGLATLGYRADPNVSVWLRSGYLRFIGKDNVNILGTTAKAADQNIIPVLLGARYLTMGAENAFRPYVAADAGAYVMSAEGSGTSTTKFGVAPQLGALIRLSEGMNLDAHANYTAVFTESSKTTNWIGFGAGLNFGL